ncbi:MAG TPA: hypothetical protein PK151_06250 [Caldisericia bacterium]|nr:hypothetical protein [Caldisericia bacterium]
MSQFWMNAKDDFMNLKYCIDNFECVDVFIRLMGSMGGDIIVNQTMTGKVLTATNEDGIKLFIDGKEVFHHTGTTDFKGWSVEYREDIFDMPCDIVHPDDECPELFQSTLRNIWNEYFLVEISFKGRIPLEEDGEFYENWSRWRIRK